MGILYVSPLNGPRKARGIFYKWNEDCTFIQINSQTDTQWEKSERGAWDNILFLTPSHQNSMATRRRLKGHMGPRAKHTKKRTSTGYESEDSSSKLTSFRRTSKHEGQMWVSILSLPFSWWPICVSVSLSAERGKSAYFTVLLKEQMESVL